MKFRGSGFDESGRNETGNLGKRRKILTQKIERESKRAPRRRGTENLFQNFLRV